MSRSDADEEEAARQSLLAIAKARGLDYVIGRLVAMCGQDAVETAISSSRIQTVSHQPRWWSATEDPPELERWLDRQVKEAIDDYVTNGFLTLSCHCHPQHEDPVQPWRVRFYPGEGHSDLARREELLSTLLEEEIDAHLDSDNRIPEYHHPEMTLLRDTLRESADRIDALLRDSRD